MTTTLQIISNTNGEVEISFINKELDITIYSSLNQLSQLYSIEPSAINYEFIKKALIDSRLNIIKKFKFNCDIEEWTNTEGTLLFKQENGIILVVVKDNPEDFIYISPQKLTNKFKMKLTDFQHIKKQQEEKKAIPIAINFENVPDLSGYNPCPPCN